MASTHYIAESIDDNTLISLATSYSLAGEYQQALECCDKLIKHAKPTAKYYCYRASLIRGSYQ